MATLEKKIKQMLSDLNYPYDHKSWGFRVYPPDTNLHVDINTWDDDGIVGLEIGRLVPSPFIRNKDVQYISEIHDTLVYDTPKISKLLDELEEYF